MPAVTNLGGNTDGGSANHSSETMSERVDSLTTKNDKLSRKINTLNAKLLYSKGAVYEKRLIEFVEKTKELLDGLYNTAKEEIEKTVQQRLSDLNQLQNDCAERALKLHDLQNNLWSGEAPSQLYDLENAYMESEVSLDSLSTYDLVISPSLASLYEAFQEIQPIYVRTSSLYPQDVELLLEPGPLLKMEAMGKALTIIAKPTHPEAQLSKLLVATMQKMEPTDTENAGACESTPDIMEGAIAPMPDSLDGSVEITFLFSAGGQDNGSRIYTINVYLYGRPIKNSPMKIDIGPQSDFVQEEEFRLPNGSSAVEEVIDAAEEEITGAAEEYSEEEVINVPSQPAKVNDSFSAAFPEHHDEVRSRGLYEEESFDGFANGSATPEYYPQPSEEEAAKNAYNPGLLRPDLTGIVGSAETPKNVTGRLIMKFGYEKVQDPADRCFAFPIGCAKNDFTNEYIICDTGHNTVKIYDASSRLKNTIVADFKRPAAVVVMENNMFAIRDNDTIKLFSHDGQFLRSTPRQPRAYGLTADNKGNLVSIELGGRSSILQIDPRDCSIINRIPFVAHLNKLGSKCRFIDCFNDYLYVVDLGASMIYGLPLDGNNNARAPFEFGGLGRQAGRFNEPSGITIDANGTLFIGDSRNDRVEICDSEGRYIGQMRFNHPIKRPSAIRLTSDGNLLVMNYVHHYVSLFKLCPMP